MFFKNIFNICSVLSKRFSLETGMFPSSNAPNISGGSPMIPRSCLLPILSLQEIREKNLITESKFSLSCSLIYKSALSSDSCISIASNECFPQYIVHAFCIS